MSELKAGGLAMVVGGNPELFGMEVRTVRLVMPGEVANGPDGRKARNVVRPKWMCTDSRIITPLADGSSLDGWGFFWINHLMPIDGEDFCNEDERKKELSHG